MNKKKLILSLFFLISLFSIISCVSTNQENINIEKPNLMDKKIDDYNIEISGTENIKYIYFYRSPTGLHFSGEPVNNNFIQGTISNISFFIGNKEYYLKFNSRKRKICLVYCALLLLFVFIYWIAVMNFKLIFSNYLGYLILGVIIR